MTAAVVVSAVAILIQAMMLFGMFRAIKSLRDQVCGFIPRAETFLATAERHLTENRKELTEVAAKATLVLDSAQKQLVRVDDVLGDATARARAQIEHIEIALDDTVNRVHSTVVELNNGILRPLREINGLAVGLRTAFQYLLRGNRPNVAEATADEEMFI